MSEEGNSSEKTSSNPEVQAQVEETSKTYAVDNRTARAITARNIWLERLRNRLSINKDKLEASEQARRIDALTGLPNRKWFEEDLDRKLAVAKRTGKKLYVIFADVDLFKAVNDNYGHPVGDKVLKAFGEIGQREEEPIARWGGEEFAQALLIDSQDYPDVDSQGNIAPMVDEIVQRIVSRYHHNFAEKTEKIIGRPLSLSFGIASYSPGETNESLVGRADAALYSSKQAGRDRATYLPIEGLPDNVVQVNFLPRNQVIRTAA